VSNDEDNTMESQKKYIKDERISNTTNDSSPPSHGEDKMVLATPSKVEYKSSELKPSSEEESLSAKAKDAAQSLKDLIIYLGQKAKAISYEKTTDLKAEAAKTADLDLRKDAHDIQKLGDNIESVITVFENIMTDIRRERYGEQERLLFGYKKLLEEQVNVIDARLKMAKRLRLASA
jgi:hypothetical protein